MGYEGCLAIKKHVQKMNIVKTKTVR